MKASVAPPPAFPELIARTALIVDSFARLLRHSLVDAGDDAFTALWNAPRVVVAHGTQADPVFFYGNRMALELFEMDFAGFTQLPSRFSAELMERDARERFLQQVSRDGYVDNYSGIRISSTGRRFCMYGGIVWNLVDVAGTIKGQAATFERWDRLADELWRQGTISS